MHGSSIVYYFNISSIGVNLFQAVKEKFIVDESVERKWHVHLADYYQYQSPNDYNCKETLPHHLEEAKLGKRYV